MARRSSDEITYEGLGVMERIILADAAEAHGDMVGFLGSQQDKNDYETLVEFGLLKRRMVKSGRYPEYGYFITDKGWNIWHNRKESINGD